MKRDYDLPTNPEKRLSLPTNSEKLLSLPINPDKRIILPTDLRRDYSSQNNPDREEFTAFQPNPEKNLQSHNPAM